jgi:hypothetical protein
VILGASHRDKEHVHLHFCVSGVKFRTGRSARLSKRELSVLKTEFQRYHREKYPFIKHSFPEHGSGREYQVNREWQAKYRRNRERLKERVSNSLLEALELANTKTEFLDMLRDRGFPHYERAGKPEGVELDGVRFRFSRLLDKDQFEQLGDDTREEQKVLEEISSIREQRKDREKSRNLDH